MLKTRLKRQAEQHARAMIRLTQLEASITRLGDEDLLDLADIFRSSPDMPVAQYALAEMARRNISL
jgi:hypothetical protein